MIDKIIFLDIDGVLNSEDWFNKFIMNVKSGNTYNGQNNMIDPDAINRVVKICKETGARIVISSSWRLNTITETIKDMYRYVDFLPLLKYIVGITPRISPGCYGKEIQSWIDNCKNNSEYTNTEIENKIKYIIISNSTEILDSQMNNFIQTKTSYGITDDIANTIINMFKNSNMIFYENNRENI